jgi:hypothetical protein
MGQIGLATVFLAVAYAIGIVMEYLGELYCEWWFNKVKRDRVEKFYRQNQATLKEGPIRFLELDPSPNQTQDTSQDKSPQKHKDTKEYIGEMRFFVMRSSALLYADITAQISRLRLIRVLPIAEIILLIAILGQIPKAQSPALWVTAVALLIAIFGINILAIRSRFGRYCRAVERSYLILLLERNDQAQQNEVSADA